MSQALHRHYPDEHRTYTSADVFADSGNEKKIRITALSHPTVSRNELDSRKR